METIIIGGGQAGLSLSYFLGQFGHEHVVLEQAAQAAHAWRNQRWDSFTFVTPNRMTQLPGLESPGDLDGYLPRDEIVSYFEDYISRFRLPVRFSVKVTSVEQVPSGFRITTGEGGALEATNVVIATGLFQTPKIPPFGSRISSQIVQLHSSQYRNPGALPPGAVLIVGSGQSGCQIAEELCDSGRNVYLSVSASGPIIPRRHRNHDAFYWAEKIGMLDRTPAMLPSPKARFAGNPQLSGTHGGHALNLHLLARKGVRLLGHLQDVRDSALIMAPDMHENLARGDKMGADFVKAVDSFIEKHQLGLPAERVPEWRDGYDQPETPELDLHRAGITSVVWATGFGFDFSLVRLPVTDEHGFPIQQRGVTAYPGLYFLGMPYLYKQKSGLLWGIGEDAEYLAAHIVGRSS